MNELMDRQMRTYFEQRIGDPPAGASRRVLDGFRTRAAEPRVHTLPRWAAAVAVLLLAAAAVGALTWTRLATHPAQPTPASPPPRSGAAFGYDEANGRLVMFGGRSDNNTVLGDTWTWTAARGWREEHPATAPPPRAGAAMAYDQERHELVMVGGVPQDSRISWTTGTWIWNGTVWTERGAAPPEWGFSALSDEFALAYDPVRHSVVLYHRLFTPSGLHSSSAPPELSETLSWNGSSWSSPIVNCGLSSGCAAIGPISGGETMAFDGRRVLLIGKGVNQGGVRSVSETWQWNGGPGSRLQTANWSQLRPATQLPLFTEARAAYDPARRVLVVVVSPAGAYQPETWIWNGADWSRQHPAFQPPGEPAALLYDSAGKRVVMVGPNAAGLWAWDGADWASLGRRASRPTATASGSGPAPVAAQGPEPEKLIATQVSGVSPRLVPTYVPAGMSAWAVAAPDGYTLTYTDDTNSRTVTLGVIANPSELSRSGKRSTIIYRGVSTSYSVLDSTATSQRSLMWNEPGRTAGQASEQAGVPYFLSASGLTEEEFFRMAESLKAV
jgi:hypothetical protein